jgi:predicted HTH domain antitoxin
LVVNLEIPDNVLRATKMSPEELRVEIAVMLFEKEKLTLGQAARFASMSPPDFQHLLGRRKISLHYGVEELLEDAETLEALARNT